jgi:hypothetical protein
MDPHILIPLDGEIGSLELIIKRLDTKFSNCMKKYKLIIKK